MDKIIDNLFLGPVGTVPLFANKNITMIQACLSIGEELTLSKKTKKIEMADRFHLFIPDLSTVGMNHKLLKIDDGASGVICSIVDEAVDFIDDNIKASKNVYVHCFAGVSRSPSIVFAYLIAKKNMKPLDAFNLIKTQRPGIYMYEPFIEEILKHFNLFSKEELNLIYLENRKINVEEQ